MIEFDPDKPKCPSCNEVVETTSTGTTGYSLCILCGVFSMEDGNGGWRAMTPAERIELRRLNEVHGGIFKEGHDAVVARLWG